MNNNCIYIYSESWHSMPSYEEFQQYPYITLIPNEQFDESMIEYEHIVVYFDMALNEEEINSILESLLEKTRN